jgi:hypothetical protein
MDEFERRIAASLNETLPPPSRRIVIDDLRTLARPRYISARYRLRKASRRRRAAMRQSTTSGSELDGRTRGRLAVAGAIGIVSVIAAVSTSLLAQSNPRVATDPGGNASPKVSGPAPNSASLSTSPTALASTSWLLARIVPTTGPAEAASAPVYFIFAGGRAVDSAGDTAIAKVEAGLISFGTWTADLIARAGPQLNIAQSHFVYTLLSGLVRWSTSGTRLTFVHPGLGSLIFREARHNPIVPPRTVQPPGGR